MLPYDLQKRIVLAACALAQRERDLDRQYDALMMREEFMMREDEEAKEEQRWEAEAEVEAEMEAEREAADEDSENERNFWALPYGDNDDDDDNDDQPPSYDHAATSVAAALYMRNIWRRGRRARGRGGRLSTRHHRG